MNFWQTIKLPRRIKLLGQTLKFSWVLAKTITKKADEWGEYDPEAKCVRLSKDIPSLDKAVEILHHELTHFHQDVGGVDEVLTLSQAEAVCRGAEQTLRLWKHPSLAPILIKYLTEGQRPTKVEALAETRRNDERDKTNPSPEGDGNPREDGQPG